VATPTRSAEPRRRLIPEWLLDALSNLEDLVYLAVALVLVGVAVASLYNTINNLINSSGAFATVVTNAVNGVLFVVIVL